MTAVLKPTTNESASNGSETTVMTAVLKPTTPTTIRTHKPAFLGKEAENDQQGTSEEDEESGEKRQHGLGGMLAGFPAALLEASSR